MFYHCPHRTQTINLYMAQQAEEKHQLEEEKNEAIYNEYWAEKETELKEKFQKEENKK